MVGGIAHLQSRGEGEANPTDRCPRDSNPGPLDPKSSILPLSHGVPVAEGGSSLAQCRRTCFQIQEDFSAGETADGSLTEPTVSSPTEPGDACPFETPEGTSAPPPAALDFESAVIPKPETPEKVPEKTTVHGGV